MSKLLLFQSDSLLDLVVSNYLGCCCSTHILFFHGCQSIFHHFVHLHCPIRHLSHLIVFTTNFVNSSLVEHPQLLILGLQLVESIFVALCFFLHFFVLLTQPQILFFQYFEPVILVLLDPLTPFLPPRRLSEHFFILLLVKFVSYSVLLDLRLFFINRGLELPFLSVVHR